MRFPSDLEPASVVRRAGRFTVEVKREGAVMAVHVANSGRIEELVAPGTPALVRRAPNGDRKTAYDLVLVQLGGRWIAADSTLANALVREALEAGRIEALRGFREVRSEVTLAGSRLDFVLTDPGGRCLVEVKSVTLVDEGVARFPDAPSGRAVRHLQVLGNAVDAGDAACLIFVVQREDASVLRPNDAVDSSFGWALREAAARGLRLLAYRCRVSPEAIELVDEIPVLL